MKKLSIILIIFGLVCCQQVDLLNEETINHVSQHIDVGFTMTGYSRQNNPIVEKITDLIDKQSEDYPLDVCIYGFNEPNIIQALKNAIYRGVQVRFVGNADVKMKLSTLQGAYFPGYYEIANALDEVFPLQYKRSEISYKQKTKDFAIYKSGSGIMHNKFIITTDKNGNKTLICGSANYTTSCLNYSYNDVLFIQDNKIAEKYSSQLDYLLGLKKNVEKDETFYIDDSIIKVCFSHNRSDSSYVMDKIINEVKNATNSIKFMVYSFTSESLTNSIIEQCNQNVSVEGVYDKSQLKYSREELLENTDIEYKIDGNETIVDGHGGKLHCKSMIIDEQMVITGSFNWSKSADIKNQENILFINNQKLANLYTQYYNKIKKEAY